MTTQKNNIPQLTKNQHFVPQSLIKHFSLEGNGVVNIYDSARGILRPPTSIKRTLSENYFYDKDNLVENFLAAHVEGPAAQIIEKIVQNPTSPIHCKKIDLLRFVAVQLSRTPRAFYSSMENLDNFTGSLIRQLGELNNINQENLEKIRIAASDPKAILRFQTVEGALNHPLLDDLEWHILINNTSIGYVLSDHPAVHYNWYLRDSKDLGYTWRLQELSATRLLD